MVFSPIDQKLKKVRAVGGGGGVQASHFGKTDFELGVGGEGQDTSQHFEGSVGSIRAILPMLGLGAKTGEKPKNSELKKI